MKVIEFHFSFLKFCQLKLGDIGKYETGCCIAENRRAPDAQHLRTFVTKSNDNFGFKNPAIV